MSMYLDTTVALILKMIHSGISNDNDNIVRFVLSKFANDFRISSTFPHLTNATCIGPDESNVCTIQCCIMLCSVRFGKCAVQCALHIFHFHICGLTVSFLVSVTGNKLGGHFS